METQAVDVVIVGAGLGGLALARELREHGIDDLVILERGHDVGGVWRDTRYPNLACDTPIELYAFSFHQGTHWSSNFAGGAEIFAYLQEIARRYDLARHLRVGTEVASAVWDDAAHRWTVSAVDGRAWNARALIWAGGLLSQPHLPTLPGADRFRGRIVHSAAWDATLDLRGKRVAVVGAGASAIQIFPYVAEHAAETVAFVRTPSHVLPKPERRYTDDDRRRFAAGSNEQREIRERLSDEADNIARGRFPMNDAMLSGIEAKWRAYIEAEVHDPRVREILTPRYRFSCRRPLVSNDYYPAFNRPSVTTIGAGALAFTADALVDSAGAEHAVDIAVFATGYDAAGMLGRVRLVGRDGYDLARAWTDRYPEAYYGTLVAGFPNLFLVNGPNVGAAAITEIVEAQAAYIVTCIDELVARGAATVEVRADAFAAYNREVQRRIGESVMLLGGCTSWYRANGGTGAVFSHWPDTIHAYKEAVARVDRDALTIAYAPERSDRGAA